MVKYLITSMLALCLAVSAFAASAPVTDGGLFNSHELSLGLGSGYVVDTSAAFQQNYTLNVAGGASYFLTRNLGLEAWVPFYTTKGVSVQEVQAGVLLRVPLAKETPLFKNVAPYVGLGGVYNWQTETKWAYIGKVGSEFRLNKKWGVFAEGQYRNDTFDNWNKGQVGLFGGLKLVF